MINHETELKLQAYLDGELSSSEAMAVGELAARDREVRSLIEELQATRTLLRDNELELKVPESQEFYWSKIRRQIERAEQAQNAEEGKTAVSPWWIRFWVPAGVVGALVVFVALALRNPQASGPALAMDDSHEIETPLEETSSFSFRSEAAAMTVVWVDSHRE